MLERGVCIELVTRVYLADPDGHLALNGIGHLEAAAWLTEGGHISAPPYNGGNTGLQNDDVIRGLVVRSFETGIARTAFVTG